MLLRTAFGGAAAVVNSADVSSRARRVRLAPTPHDAFQPLEPRVLFSTYTNEPCGQYAPPTTPQYCDCEGSSIGVGPGATGGYQGAGSNAGQGIGSITSDMAGPEDLLIRRADSDDLANAHGMGNGPHRVGGGGGGDGSLGVINHNGNMSSFPVRYFDGTPILFSADLAADGFGIPFTHTRSWSGYEGTNQGFGWNLSELPRLEGYDGNTKVLIENGTSSKFFDQASQGAPWVARDYAGETLTYDGPAIEFVVRDTAGNELRFGGGRLTKIVHAGTDVVTTAAYESSNIKLTRTHRETLTGGAVRVSQQQFVYQYKYGTTRFSRVTLRQRSYTYTPPGAEPDPSWTDVRHADYDYYTDAWTHGDEPELSTALFGRSGDLRTASISDGDPAADRTVTLSDNGTIITATSATPHGYVTGDTIVIRGSGYSGNNGTFIVTKVNDDSFSYTPGTSFGTDNGPDIRAVKPLETSYYRYAQAYSGTAIDSRERSPVRLVVTGESYARMRAAGVNPFDVSTTDDSIKPYADHYFAYEMWNDYEAYTSDETNYKVRFRVIEEIAQGAGCSACTGGQGTFKFEYATNTAAPDPDRTSTQYNHWRHKTTEYLPDTTPATWADNDRNIVYTNEVGQVMMKVFKEPGTNGREWATAFRYDDSGRLVWTASPSALSGSTEDYKDYADLLNSTAGNLQYVGDTDGLIQTISYYTSTETLATTEDPGGVVGRYKSTSLQRGETASGGAVLQHSQDYIKAPSTAVDFYALNSESVYPQGTAQTTTYEYTSWHGNSVVPQSVKTTYPTVTAAHNGSGTADSVTSFFDKVGRVTWTKDEGGYIHAFEYDPATGALKTAIQDVNTGAVSGEPTGWSTPSGGGLQLTTTIDSDKLGRPKKVTDPAGNVTYTVYNDAGYEVRVYPGWDTSTNTTTGPIQVVRQYRPAPGSGEIVYSEYLQSTATPSVNGGVPTGIETISATNIVSLAREFTNKAGQHTFTDRYFNLSGQTYTRGVTADGSQVPADLGTKDTHFHRQQFGYNKRGLPDKVVNGAGTITRVAYDAMGREKSVWIGTDDSGWTDSTTSHANMVKVSEVEYDGGNVGDSNVTRRTEYPGGAAASRVTLMHYDWRNRLVGVKFGDQGGTSESDGGVQRQVLFYDYDNLGRVTATSQYDADTLTLGPADGAPDRPSNSALRAKAEVFYDERGRPYEQRKYSIDQGVGGTPSVYLKTNFWYDGRGNVIKTSMPGGLVQKCAYDGAGRLTRCFVTDGGGDPAPGATNNWDHADDVAGDNVLEQVEYVHDLARNAVLVTTRQRFHNETDTGDLTTSGIDDRASYAATYFDKASRPIYAVDYGTNGGSAVTAPDNVGSWPSAALVTEYSYRASTGAPDTGRVQRVIDPTNVTHKSEYDLLGRVTRTIEAYGDGTPGAADDRTTEYTYDGSDNVRTITAVLPDGSDAGSALDLQMTEYVYAARVSTGSAVNSNDLLTEVRFPLPAGDSPGTSAPDMRVYRRNALGEVTRYTDQNGTVHDYAYDLLGRPTEDYASTLGTGVNGTVRRLSTTYASGGQVEFVYSKDNAGVALNTVAYAYNGLGDQKSTIYSDRSGQSHFVSYTFSEDWTNNRSRMTTLTYSGGKVLTYDYGTAGSLNDKISRVNLIKEGATTLEAYSYLGLGTIVERDRPQPGVKLTYFQSGGSGDGGDAYVGLDRFGRVVDQRWVKGTTDVDRFVYTYDRNSNRTSRAILATGAPTNLDEAYSYDALDRLTKVNRGSLSSGTITDAASVYQQTWTMDGLGNWTLFKTDTNGGGSGGATFQTRTHNRRNQVLTVSGQTAPLHDSNGNMTRDEANRTLVYDAWDRLVSVSGTGGNVTYAYDGLGRRITADYGGGNKTEFVYGDGWQVLEEFDAAGVSQRSYVWGLGYIDALVLRDQGSQRLYAQQDANWNVTSLADATGTVQERYVYDPYGTVTYKTATWGARASSSFAWVHLHQGGRLDTTTGLYHFRHRDYSATLGRWVSTDPMGYIDGMNSYLAYLSNPVAHRDSSGLAVGSIDINLGFFVGGVGWSLTGSFVYGYNDRDGWHFGLAGSMFGGPGPAFPLCGNIGLGNSVWTAPSINDLNGETYIADVNTAGPSFYGGIANPGTNKQYSGGGWTMGVGLGGSANVGIQKTKACTFSIPKGIDWPKHWEGVTRYGGGVM